jgi:tRNA(Arg) A34 adenosine deaminase TadA
MVSRNERFLQNAILQAEKSAMNMRHGALITNGSKVICAKHNTGNRTKFLKQCIDINLHAEMAVVNEFINGFIRKKKKNIYISRKLNINYDLSKYTIWCVRLDNNNRLTRSGPCVTCLKRLQKLGFGKIAYSTESGKINIVKIHDYKVIHYTQAHKIMCKYDKFKQIR